MLNLTCDVLAGVKNIMVVSFWICGARVTSPNAIMAVVVEMFFKVMNNKVRVKFLEEIAIFC